jgi:hypothetical protein
MIVNEAAALPRTTATQMQGRKQDDWTREVELSLVIWDRKTSFHLRKWHVDNLFLEMVRPLPCFHNVRSLGP